ncbi:MAG: CapA family protein [Ilumatobacteraceae bacterium]
MDSHPMRMAWRCSAAILACLMAATSSLGIADAPAPLSQPAGAVAPAVRLAPPLARPISFGFTGDIHTLKAVNNDAAQADGSYDFRPMFASVAPVLSWFDVASCHMEAPVAPAGTPIIVDAPLLSTAPSMVTALAGAGYDRCSTASNHMLDRGVAGVDTTLAAFDAAGLGHTGSARSAQEARAVLFEVRGVTFAHLSYTFYVGPRPKNEPWRVNLIDSSAIIAAARQARADGAQVVILSMEWGVDTVSAVTPYQRSIAEAVTASGQVDLIVGHQAHVLQPIGRVNGVWVVFGMGNFLSDLPGATWPASAQDAAIVGVDFTVAADGSVEVSRPVVYPTWIDKQHGHVVRLTSEADDPTLPAGVRAALRESEARTRSILGDFIAS